MAPVHTYTLVCKSLACALVREGIFLRKDGSVVLGLFFVKINQTSLHDDITGVSRFGCT